MHETQKELFKRCKAFDFQAKNVDCNLIVKDRFEWQTRSQKKQWKIQKQIYKKQTSQHVPSCHLVLCDQVTPISSILPQEMSSALEGLMAFDKLNEQPILYCNTCLKSPVCVMCNV